MKLYSQTFSPPDDLGPIRPQVLLKPDLALPQRRIFVRSTQVDCSRYRFGEFPKCKSRDRPGRWDDWGRRGAELKVREN